MNSSTYSERATTLVAQHLGRGAGRALSVDDLLMLTGFKNARSLHSQIAAERESGSLILSSTRGGFYLPAAGEQGRREIAAFVRTLRSRALSTLRALRSAKGALAIIEGQTRLEDSP